MASDGSVVIDARLDAKDLDDGLRRVKSGLDGVEQSGNQGALTIGKLAGALGLMAVAAKGMQLFTSSMGDAIKRYDTLNNFPRIMELAGFTTDEATKAIDNLSTGIDGLPTPLDEVAGTAQRIALMTGDLDGAVETTLALNNAFLASGASTGDASRGLQQYTQMLAKGEVDLQSWRTLQETMPIALNKVAEAFGFTGKAAQNDLYDALKSGEVTFDEFNEKMVELDGAVGGFAELAREASAGIGTAWTNLGTSFVRGGANILKAIDDVAKANGWLTIEQAILRLREYVDMLFGFVVAGIPAVVDSIQSIWRALEPYHEILTAVGVGFLAMIATMATIGTIVGIVRSVMGAFAALWALLIANPITLVIGLIAGFVAALVYLYNTNETVRNIVDSVWNSIKEIIMPIIGMIVDFVVQKWGHLVQWWNENHQTIFATAQTIWNMILSVIGTAVGFVLNTVQIVYGAVRDFWNENSEEIFNTTNNIWAIYLQLSGQL